MVLLCEGVLRRLAHDLKSPLRTLMAYCDAVRQDYGNVVPEPSRFMLEAIVQTAAKMDRRIEAITHLAEVLSQRSEPKTVNLRTEVNLVVSRLVAELGSERLVVNCAISPEITIEFTALDLQCIVEELLRNASTFSYRHPVQVTVTAQECSDEVNLKFTDDGIGVAQRHGERLFELFYRNNHDEEFEGVGAGLTIARALAIRNGCSLRYAEGRESAGTTFELLIPHPNSPKSENIE